LEVTGAKEESREFLIAVRVTAGAREFIKKTAEDAGLRSLPGLFLVSVERPRKGGGGVDGAPKESSSPRAQTTPATVTPPMTPLMTPPADVASIALVSSRPPNVDSEGAAALDPAVDTLQAGDVLWYAGNANAIATIRKIPGLAPYATTRWTSSTRTRRNDGSSKPSVAKTGPLVGKSIRDIKFRSRYNAVVLAVHREACECTRGSETWCCTRGTCCSSTRDPTFTGKPAIPEAGSRSCPSSRTPRHLVFVYSFPCWSSRWP
jgi:hypothetical protein